MKKATIKLLRAGVWHHGLERTDSYYRPGIFPKMEPSGLRMFV